MDSEQALHRTYPSRASSTGAEDELCIEELLERISKAYMLSNHIIPRLVPCNPDLEDTDA